MIRGYILSICLVVALAGCSQFDDLSGAPVVEPIDIEIRLASLIGDVDFGDEMLVKLDNYNEGLHYEKAFSGEGCTVTGIIPGIYTVNVSGKATDDTGEEFILAGSSLNTPFVESGSLQVDIRGAVKGRLVFSEIYYCGSKPVDAFSYFRDQFYEIANNTDEVQYLDGIYFANTEAITFDKVLPVWPDPAGEYVYAAMVWKFPGKPGDTAYPLQPGESCVVAQFAADHRLEIYNPTSPVDCSSAEFEFNTNNANFPDQPAFDMELVFNNGTIKFPTQYLTSVFGTSYIIFQLPVDFEWDPVSDGSLQARNLANPYGSVCAKVPTRYIVDAVEAIRNDSYVDAKNLPEFADAGFVTIGATYLGKGVTRRLLPSYGDAVLYQDTNNSADDFETQVTPVLHRNSRMPAWNHTLSGAPVDQPNS